MKTRFKNISVLQLFMYGALLFSFLASVYFIQHNHGFYDQPIAKITEATVEKTQELSDASMAVPAIILSGATNRQIPANNPVPMARIRRSRPEAWFWTRARRVMP